MIRGDEVMAGTVTAGTGTITLASTPVAPGALDFDAWLKATGMNFVSGNALLVSYIIKEFTDTTFSTVKQTEKGIGTLTLGASIAAATLARTTIQWTTISENLQPATPTFSSPTGINIGVPANVLVFIGPSAVDIIGCQPYVQSAAPGADTTGALPASIAGIIATFALTSGLEYHCMVEWRVPMLAKRASVKTGSVTLTGATMSAYARIYDVGTDGRPSKLLYDFGQIGNSAALQASFAIYSTGAAGNGLFLTPGIYYFSSFYSWTGGAGATNLTGLEPYVSGNSGSVGFQPTSTFSVSGGSAGAAPDPANLTSWANVGGSTNPDTIIAMMIASS